MSGALFKYFTCTRTFDPSSCYIGTDKEIETRIG